ncbi:group II intron maturase-specific domain-containing protein [Streptomyces sp. BBFR51]|uniref:group II intron maturase-specific domain-containing protein n=1 Tax=Streptomyces sp. BBFR51 TaxID=3372856 RepID=UPI0037DDD7DC
MKSVKSKVKALTTGRHDPRTIFVLLGQALRGWTTYFRHAASEITSSELEHYLWHRVWKWLRRCPGAGTGDGSSAPSATPATDGASPPTA